MLLSLLVACAPCPSFADMTLPADTPALAQVVADFAAWTGRDGVCVPAVEWRDELSGDADVLGRYDGPGAPILLRSTEGTAEVTLRHELCHALDAEEGLADTLADTLDPGSVDPLAYPGADLRLAEAFAQACEVGPPPLALREALHESCALDLDPAAAPLRTLVYPAAPAELPVSVGTPPVATPLYEHRGAVLLDAAARDGALWLLLDDGAHKYVATHRGNEPVAYTFVAEDTAALGAGDDAPLLIGEGTITTLGAAIPAFTGPALAAAAFEGALWVATPSALLGPDPDAAAHHEPPFTAIDVDASAQHVLATTPEAGLWLDGQAVLGLEGGASVALSDTGELLVTWYADGVAGVAERAGGEGGRDSAGAWTAHTTCDASLSGASPIWWEGAPALVVQADVPTLYAW